MVAAPSKKRRRWDQQTSGDEGPAKKKSAWDQAEVGGFRCGVDIESMPNLLYDDAYDDCDVLFFPPSRPLPLAQATGRRLLADTRAVRHLVVHPPPASGIPLLGTRPLDTPLLPPLARGIAGMPLLSGEKLLEQIEVFTRDIHCSLLIVSLLHLRAHVIFEVGVQ